MHTPHHPVLYQCNVRVLLTNLSADLGRSATLDDIPDSLLVDWSQSGFEWVWLLSVWQTGTAARDVSRSEPNWRREFEHTLADLADNDIAGSGFAITAYHVHAALSGNAALARLRTRMQKHGLKLMLDFVPNHMGLGHPWIDLHPDYFIAGTHEDLQREPHNFIAVETASGKKVFAHGRDPYFPGWPDTLQIDYANPDAVCAMQKELVRISHQCDGVRCDMAMLILPDIFQATWHRAGLPFWPDAIAAVRRIHPAFCFMAEVYWDREWDLQQQGFDYTYDKRLYDRLRAGHAQPVREHLLAGLDFQSRLARFLENHDEPRAAATFSMDKHRAAATLTFLSPGLRFFHQGQADGNRIRVSPHLVRGPDEPSDPAIRGFYTQILELLRRDIFRSGQWSLLECVPAWEGNGTHNDFVAFAWKQSGQPRVVVAVNYSDHASQCHVRLPFEGLDGSSWQLVDQLSSDAYAWNGQDLAARGLYLDEPAWRARVFELVLDR